jgi:AcrR family transcriptional regulator
MTRKRLTREESREQTRQRLLDAAAALLAKKGLGTVSVEDIARHAGYTRGAFYSNFKSKTDLFIELLKSSHQNIQQDLQAFFDADIQTDDLRQQLAQFYASCHRSNGNNNNYLLWAEARLYATRDAKFRQRLNTLYQEKRDTIAYFITQFSQKMGTQPPAPPEDLALALIALFDGMFYFSQSMPAELPDNSADSLLTLVFMSIFSTTKT